MLRTNLRYSVAAGDKRRVYLVTSVGLLRQDHHRANLAVVMAQGGQRTILVDADIAPSTHPQGVRLRQRGGPHLAPGGRGRIARRGFALHRGGWVAGAALRRCPPNPAELLGSARMAHLLDELSAHADIVILDSPLSWPSPTPASWRACHGHHPGGRGRETRLEAFARRRTDQKDRRQPAGDRAQSPAIKARRLLLLSLQQLFALWLRLRRERRRRWERQGDARHAGNGRAAASKSAARRMESAGPRDDVPQN